MLKSCQNTKQVVIISDSSEVAASLAKSLPEFGNIAVVACVAPHDRLLPKDLEEEAVLVLHQASDKELDYWIWDVIRKKHSNPILIVGLEGLRSYGQRREFLVWAQNHKCVLAPFLLKTLVLQIIGMRELELGLRKIVYSACANVKARRQGDVHDIKFVSDSPTSAEIERVRDILVVQKEFFIAINNKRICKDIDAAVACVGSKNFKALEIKDKLYKEYAKL